jgi:hypothetical protein
MSEETIGFSCVMVLVCGLGIAAGMGLADSNHKKDLVRRGLAEWVVDKDGEVAFRWKEAKP